MSELRIPLMMEVSLFWAEPSENTTDYKEVDKQVYRVGNIITGIYKFVPIEFF